VQKTRKIPLRECMGCGEHFDKRELLRIVKPKEEPISVDVTGRKGGRGCYLCKKQECLEKALKNKRIERSLEAPLPADFRQQVEEALGPQ